MFEKFVGKKLLLSKRTRSPTQVCKVSSEETIKLLGPGPVDREENCLTKTHNNTFGINWYTSTNQLWSIVIQDWSFGLDLQLHGLGHSICQRFLDTNMRPSVWQVKLIGDCNHAVVKAILQQRGWKRKNLSGAMAQSKCRFYLIFIFQKSHITFKLYSFLSHIWSLKQLKTNQIVAQKAPAIKEIVLGGTLFSKLYLFTYSIDWSPNDMDDQCVVFCTHLLKGYKGLSKSDSSSVDSHGFSNNVNSKKLILLNEIRVGVLDYMRFRH